MIMVGKYDLQREKDMSGKNFLYMGIYQKLKAQILSGELRPEEKLPSEDELAQECSVSKITVKKALELLKEEGLIHRVQGRGTFVNPIDLESPPDQERPKRNSRLVGLVLEHASSAFGLDMMYAIDRRLNEQGYKLCIRFTYGSTAKESEEIDDLLSMDVAGLIIMPCHDSHYNMTILRLILERFPVVLVDKRMHGLPVHSVCTDGREAMRVLAHHLKERGCENAAMITIDPASTSSLGDRAEGFYKGLEETGMRCAGECILPRRTDDMLGSEPEPQYVAGIGEYLDSLEKLPDSFICTEYAIARALYSASAARNMMPGVDFKACCMDENALATEGSFFTHVRQDEVRIAQKAVEILVSLIRGETCDERDVRIQALFHMGHTT